MITFDAVIGGDEGDTKKLIFSGDINYLKEVMKKALNEISKGERK